MSTPSRRQPLGKPSRARKLVKEDRLAINSGPHCQHPLSWYFPRVDLTLIFLSIWSLTPFQRQWTLAADQELRNCPSYPSPATWFLDIFPGERAVNSCERNTSVKVAVRSWALTGETGRQMRDWHQVVNGNQRSHIRLVQPLIKGPHYPEFFTIRLRRFASFLVSSG